MDYREQANEIIANLKKRHFDAYYFDTKEEAADFAISLIGKDDTVGWGGSVTMSELSLLDKLKEKGIATVNRDIAKNPDERFDLMRKALLSDVFLMSSNAVSKDGILVNIDGFGNRVAALCFGPKSVIVSVGMNKVCDTLEDAVWRARNVAAVKNAKRFGLTKTGCVSGKCLNCLSDECICSHVVITRKSNRKGRIKVILIGEELGF